MSRATRSLLMIMVGIGAASPVLCAAQGNNTGAVFIMTNDAKKNQVIAYERAANGTLSEPVYYDTNGRGSGGTTDPLESQGSLTLSQDHSLLFAVNAGSGTVSVFSVHMCLTQFVERRPLLTVPANILRESWQIGHAGGGCTAEGNCVPKVTQNHAVPRSGGSGYALESASVTRAPVTPTAAVPKKSRRFIEPPFSLQPIVRQKNASGPRSHIARTPREAVQTYPDSVVALHAERND